VAGQVAQLAAACSACAMFREEAPPVFVGHSWGGWIAIMAAARGPVACAGLVLTGCGPLVEHYAAHITPARMRRLGSQSAANTHRWRRSSEGRVRPRTAAATGRAGTGR
jgi:pimeloyl-ACP methyl ester carboxylesterase